jgi:hypothetical protein
MARSQFMVQIGFLASPEVACVSEEALGAWLRCQAYSASQLAEGRIVGARAWDGRRWLTTARVDLQAIGKAVEARLLTWDGPDLLVTGYDHDGERLYNAKSVSGKKNRGRSPKGKLGQENDSSDDSSDDSFNAFPSLPSPVLTCPSVAEAGETPSPPLPEDAFAKADQSAAPKRQHTLGDLEACHAVLVVFRDDRDTAETLLSLYGWDACNRGISELTPAAKARQHGRQRVTISELRGWLGSAFELEAEDYRRAGLTPPSAKEAR